MITSLSWLKNHLSTKSNLNQVIERLTEIGLEVENVKSLNGSSDSSVDLYVYDICMYSPCFVLRLRLFVSAADSSVDL